MKSKILALSKNEEFKNLLKQKKISNKYVSIFFGKLLNKDEKRLNSRVVAKKKIGFWHKIKKKKLINSRKRKINKFEAFKFIKYLNKIGYFGKNLNKNKKLKLVKSFQRRFRQELVNGIIDKECLIIAEKLSKIAK